MSRTITLSAIAAVAGLTILSVAVPRAQERVVADGPSYNADGSLIRPSDYREWIYLSSGYNMTYGAAAPDPARNHPFNNVFVNPTAYREFVQSGRWPDKTIFILEVRASEEHVRPNAFGFTQAQTVQMEAAVKDSRNGENPWAYYSFDSDAGLTESATPFPATARCQVCHAEHTAVEQTFVQFYPTLFEIAKAKGVVKTTWSPALVIEEAPAGR
jgi:hypothetical protein